MLDEGRDGLGVAEACQEDLSELVRVLAQPRLAQLRRLVRKDER